MNDFYVYGWRRPDTGAVFYIGKGRGKRDKAPKYNNQIFMRTVDKLKTHGLEPYVERLQENLTEDEAFKIERAEIAKYGRRDNGTGILANMTDGGEGTAGRSLSTETKAKISAAHLGKTLSPDHRARLLERVCNPTEETRAKMSAAQVGRKHSEKTRALMSKNNGSRLWENKAKISAALKGVPKSEEHRANLGGKKSKAHIAKISTNNRMRQPLNGFKGVSFNKQLGKWKVAIRIGNKRPFLGYFTNPEEAAKTYDRAAIEAWGVGNCYLNLPEEIGINEWAGLKDCAVHSAQGLH